MTKPIIRIHNTETDEIIDREINDSEFAVYQADQKAQSILKAQAAIKETAKEALLNKLGITAEEAKLLLA
jgi:ATP-dependent Zn protease